MVADNHFAIRTVWARRQLFQRKADGCSLHASSTCGGRPGEKSNRDLSEAFNICRSTAMKFSGGGVLV